MNVFCPTYAVEQNLSHIFDAHPLRQIIRPAPHQCGKAESYVHRQTFGARSNISTGFRGPAVNGTTGEAQGPDVVYVRS